MKDELEEDNTLSSLLRTNKEIEDLYERHVNTVYRVCFMYLKGNIPDIEDAIQTTFLKTLKKTRCFESVEHEKAWLIVTASNVCKDMLTSSWKVRIKLNNDLIDRQETPLVIDHTLESVMALPNKFKTSIYMFYYEGYSCQQIASLLGKKETSVWSYLHKGRKMLAKMLEEEER